MYYYIRIDHILYAECLYYYIMLKKQLVLIGKDMAAVCVIYFLLFSAFWSRCLLDRCHQQYESGSLIYGKLKI